MMASVSERHRISDEDWLISKAQSFLSEDEHAAKAWLITARSLFPRNIDIQMEAYRIEKNGHNIKEAAKCLEDIASSFPNDHLLWKEMSKVTDALQNNDTDEKIFLAEVFDKLPMQLQCGLLMKMAEKAGNVIDETKLRLLVLNKYPENIAEQGIHLIDSLLSAEKHQHLPTPVNCYRKYIVCDILPLILKYPLHDKLTPKLIYRWLQKTTEFFTCYITHGNQPIHQQSPDILSPTKKAAVSFSTQPLRRLRIAGIPDKDSFLPDPWGSLFDIVYSAAEQLQWDISSLYHHNSRAVQWEQITQFVDDMDANTDKASAHKMLLYTGVPLFLHCLFLYSVQVDPEQFTGSASQSGTQRCLVVVEGVSNSPISHLIKKPKTLQTPVISVSTLVQKGEEVKNDLQMAVDMWKLFQNVETLRYDFVRLLQHWKTDSWLWLKNFEIDVTIFEANYENAIGLLKNLKQKMRQAAQVRLDLQLASCYLQTKDFQSCTECILQVLDQLPVESTSHRAAGGSGSTPAGVNNGSGTSSGSGTAAGATTAGPAGGPLSSTATEQICRLPEFTDSNRHLHVLCCTQPEILAYCVAMLLHCLKMNSLGTPVDSTVLGHMIVLTQYDWPTHQHLFNYVINVIKRTKSFIYNVFLNYVVNVDILEEFAFLKNSNVDKITLDILSQSSQTATQQRTVTRGVNKGATEDFRASIEKQTARSGEDVTKLIQLFLTEQKQSLLLVIK